MLIVNDDNKGVTRHSVQVWRDHRQMFGTFVEARIYSRGDGALIDGRLMPWRYWPSRPAMVLIDEQDNELWLTGTPCGYAGEGPAGAEAILRAEGFGDAAETVYDRRLVKVVLRKDGGAITSELTERGQRCGMAATTSCAGSGANAEFKREPTSQQR